VDKKAKGLKDVDLWLGALLDKPCSYLLIFVYKRYPLVKSLGLGDENSQF
jgi:hypothetical protein